MQGVPVDSANACAPEMGGPVVCPVVSAAAAQTQSGAALPGVIPHTAPGASTPSVPALIPTSPSREMAPSQEQQIKEADLMWCIQALLQSHEMLNGSRTEHRDHHQCPAKYDGSCDTEEDSPEEHSEDTGSEDDELNILDVSPVKDTSCKTSYVKKVLKSRKETPEETAQKVRAVKYLMGELRALVTDQGEDIFIVQ